jgi:hypothetical protein
MHFSEKEKVGGEELQEWAKIGCCIKRVDLFYQRTARASSSAGSRLLASGVYTGLLKLIT